MAKANPARHAPQEVDAYLAALPEDIRAALERVRGIVRALVPACSERVSYGIPIFRLQKDLVGISAQQDHCALHTMSPPLMQAMADALQGVKVSGATIHFTPDAPLSTALITQVVQARLQENGFA